MIILNVQEETVQEKLQTCWNENNWPFKALRSVASRNGHLLLQIMSNQNTDPERHTSLSFSFD